MCGAGSGAATVAGGDRDRAERDARIEQAGTAGALAVERRAAPQAAVDASTGDVAAASSSRIEPMDQWGIHHDAG